MIYPESRILIFAKAPITGQVKTRLIPALGAEGAADLYRELLDQMLKRVVDAAIAPVELWCAPDSSDPIFQTYQRDMPITLHTQSTGDLGDRMLAAADSALLYSSSVVLIGVDCPQMSSSYIQQAMVLLDTGDQAVLGPAEDGGYVLLGLRQVSERLFEQVNWGTGSVLSETEARLRVLGWRYSRLATLWDLDRPDDLQRYYSLPEPGSSAAF